MLNINELKEVCKYLPDSNDSIGFKTIDNTPNNRVFISKELEEYKGWTDNEFYTTREIIKNFNFGVKKVYIIKTITSHKSDNYYQGRNHYMIYIIGKN